MKKQKTPQEEEEEEEDRRAMEIRREHARFDERCGVSAALTDTLRPDEPEY